jgi:glycosyltransferase involved in cell wall biosynthesis
VSVPQVSILMPVRNEERYLPATLASLFRQSLKNWELIAVDDGSTDGTAGILRTAARADGRVRVLSRPPAGLVPALNAGLSLCRAPVVARMDGDDICHSRRLEQQVRLLSEMPELTLAACAVRHFPRPGLQEGMKAYEKWQNALLDHDAICRDLFVESPFAHPSVAFRKEAVERVGGYRDRGWAEDYDLWLRLAAVGARFARLPRTLLYWRDRPERLTRTAGNCTLEAFRACKVHHLKLGFLREEEAVTLWGAGLEGKAWRKALLAEGITVSRWAEIDPRKIGQTIHGAPVVPIENLKPGQGKILVTVGAKGARSQVRAWARMAGLAEERDFVCVT